MNFSNEAKKFAIYIPITLLVIVSILVSSFPAIFVNQPMLITDPKGYAVYLAVAAALITLAYNMIIAGMDAMVAKIHANVNKSSKAKNATITGRLAILQRFVDSIDDIKYLYVTFITIIVLSSLMNVHFAINALYFLVIFITLSIYLSALCLNINIRKLNRELS